MKTANNLRRFSYLRFIVEALACSVLLAACGGSQGAKASKMVLTSNNAVAWKNLCKRINVNFTDDAGKPTRYGRTDALRVSITGAQAYSANTCSGPPTNYAFGAPENNNSVFFVKATDFGTVTITVASPLSASLTLETQVAEAQLVLGQTNFTGYAPNAGGSANGATMNNPLDISRCGSRFVVGDALNNRLLVWNSTPTLNGQPADIILGQPDAVTTTGATTQTKMKLPNSAVCVGNKLYVADFGNSRILGFNSFPASSGAMADFVWGQPDFTTGTLPTTPSALNDIPAKLTGFGAAGLVASNPNWDRLLLWNTAPASNNDAANVVLGQKDFASQGNNTTVTGTNGPYGNVRGNYLFVGDTRNNRVLVYDTTTIATNAPATLVLGQTVFTSANAGSTPAGLWSPLSVEFDGDHVIVSDTQNSRILIWNGIPTTNGAPADLAIGTAQGGNPNLQGSGSATSQSGQFAHVYVDGPYLWTSDYNNRVLRFPAP